MVRRWQYMSPVTVRDPPRRPVLRGRRGPGGGGPPTRSGPIARPRRWPSHSRPAPRP